MSKTKRDKMKAKERRHLASQPAADRPSGPSPTSTKKPAQRSAQKSGRHRRKRWLGLNSRQWMWIGLSAILLIVAAAFIWWWTTRQPPAAAVPTPTVALSTPAAAAPTPTVAAPAPTSNAKGDRPLSAVPPSQRLNYYSAPPEMQIDPEATYTATFHTVRGDVVVELHADKAPSTVNNFVFLANEGYYDGTTFHRVISGFMAQGGDPSGTGSGGPGYRFADEFHPDLRHDGPGVLSMANSGANTNGSQFFITYSATPHLDDIHSVFGHVIEGMDVLEAIAVRDPSSASQPGDLLESITIDVG
ncbi:MAG TPA: peptidylprolyl isomerase [Anaerolineae bacterium]|nr:peptidylprolyl isomerase [Anaerolineae bacterium]